jgi:PAS domain S-box-containing protein
MERASLAEAVALRRAYGLTGDDAWLDTYAVAVRSVGTNGQAVRALTVDNASQQRRLDVLEPLVRKRISMCDAAIERKHRNAAVTALDLEEMNVAGALDVQIFSALSDMVNEELRLLVIRRHRTGQNVTYIRLVQGLGTIAGLVILLGAFDQLRRETRRRFQSERAARASEESLATTLMSIGDGVIVTDREGRVVRMNRVAEQLTGWTVAPALGTDVSEIFKIIDAETRVTVPDPVEHAIREGITVGIGNNTLLIRRDGSELPIADSCSPVLDAQRTVRGAVLVFRDISEAQQVKKLKEVAQRQMIFSDRMVAVGTLAAGVAHEINNPLAYVTANLDMILEEVAVLSGGPSAGRMKELGEMAAEARQGAERVQKIVRGLKTFSRADEERPTVLDVRSVLELAINMAFNEIRHRARLVKDYGVIPLVEADEARLGQVFINLLVNAAQAIPPGDVAANEVRVMTSTDSAGRAVVEVRDTGPGIPQAVVGRIFDPFFTTKPIGVGTGLGLSICHNIITGMGGEIVVTSELGRGTTFRVTLPPSAGALAVSPAPAPESPTTSPRAKVLIVDDERLVGDALARVLRGHDVTAVTRAQEALDLLATGKHFDVVFSDLMMPEMSGMDLYEELARKYPQIAERVVFLTGGAFTPEAKAFLDRVSNQRFEKPFDSKTVRALVQTFAR